MDRDRAEIINELWELGGRKFKILEYGAMLKNIKTSELVNFKVFCNEDKTQYVNKEQAVINGVIKFNKRAVLTAITDGKFRFKNREELKRFLDKHFRGEVVASGVKPFVFSVIKLNDNGQFLNLRSGNLLNLEDEAELLNGLLQEQDRIGVVDYKILENERLKIERVTQQKEKMFALAFKEEQKNSNAKVRDLDSALKRLENKVVVKMGVING